MHEVSFNAVAYLAGYAAGKREGILQAADQVDCGCTERSEVVGHLAAGETRRAEYACRNQGCNCMTILAHEIRDLAKDESA